MNVWQQQLAEKYWLVGAQGRMDHNLTPQFEQTLASLLNEGNRFIIIDLSRITYINSGGLRTLVSGWRQANKLQGKLVLCGLNERLLEIFTMVGFEKVFDIYLSTDAAKTAIKKEIARNA